MTEIIVSNFYKFTPISDLILVQEAIKQKAESLSLKGTILLAEEGINASISGPREQINLFYDFLNSTEIGEFTPKENNSHFKPFLRMKVKIKKEIVTFGADGLNVNENKGQYITAEDWDNFIARDDVILIDTRNKYETCIGSFKKAIDPQTDNFRDFPNWVEKNHSILKDRKIAMFCTGGIRCEKSTAYMKKLGYNEVYHLEGGILKYLEAKKNAEKSWYGSCFVFDDRVAVNENLEPDSSSVCEFCNVTLGTDDLKRAAKYGRQKACIYCLDNNKLSTNNF